METHQNGSIIELATPNTPETTEANSSSTSVSTRHSVDNSSTVTPQRSKATTSVESGSETSNSDSEDDTSGYCADSDSNDGMEHNTYLFPRCEFLSRYQGTTFFAMKDEKHWGTYFRSTPRGGGVARYTSTNTVAKTYYNDKLNSAKSTETGRSALVKKHSQKGTFHNPYKFEQFQRAVNTHEPRLSAARSVSNPILETDNLLYDQILEYKLKMCNVVVNAINAKNSLAYISNDYPCVMVQTASFLLSDVKDKASWSRVLMAYLTAIVNHQAIVNATPYF